MSQSEHTPGPWRPAINLGAILGPSHGEGPGPVYANHFIAWMEKEETGWEANACLIAAAPELLAACEDYLYGRKDASECESQMRSAVEKARRRVA